MLLIWGPLFRELVGGSACDSERARPGSTLPASDRWEFASE